MNARHAALLRGEDGNLHVRAFATAAEATDAARGRELPPLQEIQTVVGRRGGEIRSVEFARRLGVHGRTIRRAYERGALPGAKEHGEKILVIPVHLLRLAEAYGLRGVERMAKAGMI